MDETYKMKNGVHFCDLRLTMRKTCDTYLANNEKRRKNILYII